LVKLLAKRSPILANHGGQGIHLWLQKETEYHRNKQMLSEILSISAPLARTNFALTQLPQSDWREYIELCKNMTPAPNKEQWEALCIRFIYHA
jgi:hypothetical protein